MEKYFRPSIEDIHVGYECQFCNENWPTPIDSNNVTEIPSAQGWWNVTIDEEHDLEELSWGLMDKPVIRTPYLTKEQIEAEGWTYLHEPDLWMLWSSFRFEKPNYLLIFEVRNKKIRIIEKESKEIPSLKNQLIYQGDCPSINEFRKICKLLNIK